MQYQPLDFSKYETRLLKLLAARTDSDESTSQIECELLHGVSLLKPPQYRALSYCWGDPCITAPILVDGRSVQVTVNLEAALRELRRSIQSGTHRLIWVDALCINQDDLYERSYQVMQMGHVFPSAECVIAWLGVPRDAMAADHLFSFLRGELRGVSELDRNALIDAANSLYDLPFWKRVWIIQEIAKAKAVYLQFGWASIPWTRFVKRVQSKGIRKIVPPDFRFLLYPLDSFRDRENVDDMGSSRVSLFQALSDTRYSLSTDPRDKIYALLGLTSDGASIVPLPNYQQSVRDVFMQTGKNIIIGQGRVGAMLLARRSGNERTGSGILRLPSWVPDWSATEGRTMSPWIEECMKQMYTVRKVPVNMTPEGGLYVPCRLSETIGAVLASATSPAQSDQSSVALQDLDSEAFVRQLYTVISWYDSSQTHASRRPEQTASYKNVMLYLSDRFWSGEGSRGKTRARLKVQQKEVDFVTLFLRTTDSGGKVRTWMQANGQTKLGRKTVREMLQEDFQQMNKIKFNGKAPRLSATVLSEWLNRFENHGMRIAITDRKMRIVHEDTRPGDVIAYLPNCPLPVILRPTTASAQYTLVGEVYPGESESPRHLEGYREVQKNDEYPHSSWKADDVECDKENFIEIT